MPPRLICIEPGCDDLAEPGLNRCADHQAKKDARVAARKAEAKTSAVAREGAALYASEAWRSASKGFLRKHPLCADCQDLGLVVPATEVDHIIPHRGDRGLFWQRRNWQSLCKPCHSRKTAREVFHQRNTTGG